MNARLLAAALAAGTVVVAAPAADAAPKTVKGSYDVTLPVPFPADESIPDMNGCWNGQETLSKNSHAYTVPAAGALTVKVDFEGDWDLYLFDAKGAILAASENYQTGSVSAATEKLTWKKGKKGQQVTMVACNWLGLPDATVSWTFTYAR